MGVKTGGLVEIYPVYIYFDSKFSQEFRLNVFQGQLESSEVKLGSNPSQTGVKSARLVEIHPIYICFDSEFCR